MKKSILLVNLILMIFVAFGQINLRDNLWGQFATAKDDTTRVIMLARLSDIYITDVSPDSAFVVGQRGLKLADSIGYIRGQMSSRISIARASRALGDFETTIKLGYSVLAYANASGDSSALADAFAVLGSGYQTQGDFREAMKWVSKNLELEQHTQNCTYCAVFLASIGNCYYGMEKYDSSLVYLKKALSYPHPWGFGWIALLMGQTQEKLNNYNVAFDYYHQSINDLLEFANSKDLPGAYTSLARLYLKVGNTDSCIRYAKLALNFAQQKKFNKEAMDAALVLSAAYEKVNNAEALRYYKLAMNTKDDLYSIEKQRRIIGYKFNEELRQNEIKSAQIQLQNKIRLYVLSGILCLFLVLMIVLIRTNKHKQKANLQIKKAYADLKSTQSQLIQSEKMASLGELTAGIAHEIQNPLNFVNNFSDVNKELLEEMKDEMGKGNLDDANALANDIIANEEKINHHGKRADAIVKGMLQHSRTSSGQREATDINALCDEYLRLSYHGLRAKDKSFNATLKTDYNETIGNINIIPQDIGRVLLNLLNNAFYAVNEKSLAAAQNPGGLKYEPTVSITTKNLKGNVTIIVADNGNGIPPKIKDKIFQPFFTTKPTGQGTGLGLSLSYDIVKAHGGELKVETKPARAGTDGEGEGTEFTIQLPIV